MMMMMMTITMIEKSNHHLHLSNLCHNSCVLYIYYDLSVMEQEEGYDALPMSDPHGLRHMVDE